MVPFPTGYAMGSVRMQPATVLAPMAGVTDTVFRRLIRGLGGCGLIMTEFTSSHGVVASSTPQEQAQHAPSTTWTSSPRSTPSPRSCSAPTRE